MITKQLIERINYLYNKQQKQGLSVEEKEEQTKLRRIYIDTIKSRVRSNLEEIKNNKAEESPSCTCSSDCCTCKEQ